MTAQEIQKRNQRAQKLRVIQVNDGAYYVESSEGKICYKVIIDDEDFFLVEVGKSGTVQYD